MINVIKIGGNVVDNPALLDQFVSDFAALEGPCVLVHGGGVMASQMQRQMGMTPLMVEGRRVTDEETLRIVTMVYAGWCGKHIAALLQAAGRNAISLSGCDANVIRADRRPPRMVKISTAAGDVMQPVDYGFVGDVRADGVNAQFILQLLNAGVTPVFNAINHNGHGDLLNTNADTIASCVAQALAQHTATRLIFCFEKPGVLLDKDDDTSVIDSITPAYYAELKAEGRVADGMIPKLDNAFAAIAAGVDSVVIKHAMNLGRNIGTTLHA